MTTANESVIVSGGACSCCSTSTVHVHHRDYPEAMAEGMSAEMAAGHLANQLTRPLDHTPRPRAARGHRTGPRRGPGLPYPSRSHAACRRRRERGRRECHGDPACAAGRGHRSSPARAGLAGARTTALVKTRSLEVIRLVIPRGKEIPTHTTRGRLRYNAWRAGSPSRPATLRTSWGPVNCSTSRANNPPSWGSTTPRSS